MLLYSSIFIILFIRCILEVINIGYEQFCKGGDNVLDMTIRWRVGGG